MLLLFKALDINFKVSFLIINLYILGTILNHYLYEWLFSVKHVHLFIHTLTKYITNNILFMIVPGTWAWTTTLLHRQRWVKWITWFQNCMQFLLDYGSVESKAALVSPNLTCWFLADLSAEYLRNSMYRPQTPCPLHCSLTNHNLVAARQKLGTLYHPERREPLCRSWCIPTTRNTLANCLP